MVFPRYSDFLHYLQLASHELATFGINVMKNEIPNSDNICKWCLFFSLTLLYNSLWSFMMMVLVTYFGSLLIVSYMASCMFYPLEPLYCKAHSISVCLYVAYIACGSASLYIKTLYFYLTVLALSLT